MKTLVALCLLLYDFISSLCKGIEYKKGSGGNMIQPNLKQKKKKVTPHAEEAFYSS